MDELKTTLNFATRLILFITFPATVGLVLLRREIIEVLFQHGDFDAASTALTAWALPFFALGLSAFAMVKIIVPAFYALQDTRTPVKIAFIAHVSEYRAELSASFGPLRNGGPALATSLSAFFNSISLLVIFYQALRFVRRTRHRAIDREIHRGVRWLGVVTYAMIHWPGFYAGRIEPENFRSGSNDRGGEQGRTLLRQDLLIT